MSLPNVCSLFKFMRIYSNQAEPNQTLLLILNNVKYAILLLVNDTYPQVSKPHVWVQVEPGESGGS